MNIETKFLTTNAYKTTRTIHKAGMNRQKQMWSLYNNIIGKQTW